MVAKLKGNVLIARTLRRDATDAERKLWFHLRNRQADRTKFRRQVPIGRYVVDFCCLHAKLIVELDGSQHADNVSDEERTRYLATHGFRVLRFWNNDVNDNLEGVIETIIAEAVARRQPLTYPLPKGEEEFAEALPTPSTCQAVGGCP